MTSAQYRQRLNLPPAGQGGVQTVAKSSKPQIRLPKKREPNKTENSFLLRCSYDYPSPRFTVLYEPFALHISSGRYTPDVVVIETESGKIHRIIEVKAAFIKSSASIRAFKEARAAYPFWRFTFAQKRDGAWTFAE